MMLCDGVRHEIFEPVFIEGAFAAIDEGGDVVVMVMMGVVEEAGIDLQQRSQIEGVHVDHGVQGHVAVRHGMDDCARIDPGQPLYKPGELFFVRTVALADQQHVGERDLFACGLVREQCVIDGNAAELVLDGGDFLFAAFSENAIDQRGLAAAQKTGDEGAGDGGGHGGFSAHVHAS